jgi:pimeloyl-ACP methyl ester carboxylesterase
MPIVQINFKLNVAATEYLLRWEDLSDVILCGHSYGGNVITGAADQVPERIRELVYLDAFVPEDGECVFDLHSPERARKMRLQAQTAGDGWNVSPIPAERFNVNPGDAAWVNAQCTAQSIASFEERIRCIGCTTTRTIALMSWLRPGTTHLLEGLTRGLKRNDGRLARFPVDTK